MAQFQFDASTVQPDTGVMDAIPAGWYNVMAEKSEIKPTKAADGSCYLEFVYNIVDGQYAGRKLFDRFNIRNTNPTAQEIGYRQLSALAHAVGVIQFQDSAQLHNIPFKVKVKVRAADAQYEASNEISARKHISENVGGPAAAAPVAAAPQQFAPPAQQAPQGWGAPVAAPAQQYAPQPPAVAPQPPVQQPTQQYAVQQPAQQWTPPPTAAAQPWTQAPQPGAPVAPQQPQPMQAPAGIPQAQYPGQGAAPPWNQARA